MKSIVLFLFLAGLVSCKKDHEWITATVIARSGCYPNSWLVQLDNPDRSRQPFLCEPTQAMLSSSTTNCGNAALILNLPAAFAYNGARIKFSNWEDKGLLCFSSTLAPHHLEVSDLSGK